jgi:NHL repeat-containing protein
MIARRLTVAWLVSLCALVGVLAFAVSPAGAAQTRRELGTFGGASSSVVDPYPLSDPQGLAVDQETEDVYVADAGNHRVEKFSATGQFLLAFGGSVGGLGTDVCGGLVACQLGSEGSEPGDLTTPKFIAVDNDPSSSSFHDVYVADTADNLVSKFTEEGVLIATWGVGGQLSGGCEKPGESAPCSGSKVVPFGSITGIAVGSTGTLYVLTQAGSFSGDIFEFEPSSKSLSTFISFVERSETVGFGVSSTGNFFLNEHNLVIDEFGPTDALIGYVTDYEYHNSVTALTVDSNGEWYAATVDGALQHDAFNSAGEVLESGGGTCAVSRAIETGCGVSDSVQVGFAGSGIAVAAGSGDTLLSNAGAGTVYRYGPLGPAIPPEEPRSEQAVEVTAASAKLEGVLDTNTEGEPGAYEFLYRQSATQCEGGKATPAAPAAGKRGEMVSAVAGELLPGTVYTFCLRASNGVGETAIGTPVTFTTRVAVPGAEGLNVSDVAATSGTLNASVNPGGSVTSYVFEDAPVGGVFAPAPGADGAGTVAEGTQSVPVSVHAQGLQAGTAYEFRVSVSNSAGSFVSEPLSFTTQAAGGGLVLADGRQWELVSPADKHGALIRGIGGGFGEGGVVQGAVGGDAMTFLASVPTEGVPPGYAQKEQVLSTRGPDGWVSRDISPPHEHVVPVSVGQGEEYVAFSEDLSLAVLRPHGAFEPLLSPEASEQTPYLRTNFLHGNVNEPCIQSCYRPLVTGKPGYADVAPGSTFGEEGKCPPHALCGPEFSGATPDLSHIALSSEEPLLGEGENEKEGYEWTDGRLSKGNHLPGLREWGSEDGSWSYSASSSASGTSLYVSHGGARKLVAEVSLDDNPDTDAPVEHTARVSPNGRWFAFMSDRDLTGYDTHDAVSGRSDEEVYLYHAPEDLASEAGTLVCASCNPTGARPIGREARELQDNEHGLAVSIKGPWEEEEHQWIAANVPGWTPYKDKSAIYQSRYLSDGGRLFFDSNDALVPQDVNGNEDVYEYEPVGYRNEEGETECTTASALYSPRSDGCVGLISSGQAAGESAFLDASGSGSDVFFLTAARLVPQDYDSALDVYDAHECTSAAPCFPTPAAVPPPCDTGDACKPAPSPQPAIYGSPSSETFSGAGNVIPEAPAVGVKAKAKGSTKAQELARALRSCRAKRGARRRACERRARARFARRSTRTAKKGRG